MADFTAQEVLEITATTRKLQGADLRCLDLSRANLSCADLQEADLSWAILVGAIL